LGIVLPSLQESEFTPQLFSVHYCSLVLFHYFVNLKGHYRKAKTGVIGNPKILYHMEIINIVFEEEQPREERVACLRKCRRRSRIQSPPYYWLKRIPLIWLLIGAYMDPEKTDIERLRRAIERREGHEIDKGLRGECSPRPGQPGGSCSKRNRKFLV